MHTEACPWRATRHGWHRAVYNDWQRSVFRTAWSQHGWVAHRSAAGLGCMCVQYARSQLVNACMTRWFDTDDNVPNINPCCAGVLFAECLDSTTFRLCIHILFASEPPRLPCCCCCCCCCCCLALAGRCASGHVVHKLSADFRLSPEAQTHIRISCNYSSSRAGRQECV